jgi:hypothetical protein
MIHREQQAIRERAFAIWEQEGRPSGNAVAHWLRAEAEVKTEAALGPAEPLSEKISSNRKPTKRSQRLSLVAHRQVRNLARLTTDKPRYSPCHERPPNVEQFIS